MLYNDLVRLHRKVLTQDGIDQLREALRTWIRETAKFAAMLEMTTIGELAPHIGVGARTLPDSPADCVFVVVLWGFR